MGNDGSDDDAPIWLRQLAGTYRGIKFGRGVVGKTSYAAAALIGVWAIIAFRLSESLVLDGALLFAGALATLFVFWWTTSTQKFAEKNPAQAMLDGGELLEYKKFEVSAKRPLDTDGTLVVDPKGQTLIEDRSAKDDADA